MKFGYLSAIATLALACSALQHRASADVTWEHTGSVTVSQLPGHVVDFKIYSSFTPQHQRTLFKYNLSPFIPAPVSSTGSFALIQRLDDDKLIGYESNTKTYISESRNLLLSQLISDPWKKLDPKLSEGPVPEFTPLQRERLGAELRATVSPLLKRYSRTYFRALPETRTFAGIEGRGYRLTQLVNVGALTSKAQWAKATCEWWLAGYQPGDEIIRKVQEAGFEQLRKLGWPSKSMWSNETGYVMLYSLPDAYMQALRTVATSPSLDSPGEVVTPLSIDIKLSVPQMPSNPGSDIGISMTLKSRTISALPASVFEAPTGYQYFDLKPFVKQFAEMRDKTTIEDILQQMEKRGNPMKHRRHQW